MSDDKQHERRRTPRIKAEHTVVLRGGKETEGEAGIEAQSIDLNLGGIYCTLNRHIELFSKLEVDLTLPIRDTDGNVFHVELEASAVAVRIEPEEATEGCTSYEAALAFLNLSPEAELILAKYMLQSMTGSLN